MGGLARHSQGSGRRGEQLGGQEARRGLTKGPTGQRPDTITVHVSSGASAA